MIRGAWRVVLVGLVAVPILVVGCDASADPAPPTAPAPETIFVESYGLDSGDYDAVIAYPPGGAPYEVPVYPDLIPCLTVDVHGNIYVCDRYRVIEHHADGSPDTQVNADRPVSVVVDAAGTMFVVDIGDDDGGDQVLAFPADGGPVHQIGDFQYADAIAQGADGELYVADQRSLWRIHPDGTGQTRIGGRQFAYSDGLAVAPDGDVYDASQNVANTITIAPADGGPIRRITNLDGPVTPVFDADGSLLVAEIGARQVLRMAPDGSNRTVVIDGRAGDLAVYIPAATPALVFTSPAPASAKVGDTYQASAAGPSSAPVTFAATPGSGGVCTVTVDGQVSFIGPGVCTVVARQAGDATHPRARPVRQRIRVSPEH